MSIHMAVFACLGIFTERGWSLMITFVCVLIPTIIIKRLLVSYVKHHPENKILNRLLTLKR